MSFDLVSDIGGTNMRVGRVQDGLITQRWDFPMTADRDLAEQLGKVAQELGGSPRAVIAAGAGPVVDGQIRLTNGGWLLCETQIAQTTGSSRVRVINDFEAAAWSLASITPDDVRPIGGTAPLQDGIRVAVGPGTGLGVGALTWDSARYSVVPGEGGHVGLAPKDSADVPIFEKLVDLSPSLRCGGALCLEAEGMLSGTGLPLLYQACGGAAETSPAAIFERSAMGEPQASRCVQLFGKYLAGLCGDLAVTMMAKGGVFLVGGVAQANPNVFDDAFWAEFASGGRFSDVRKACGVYLVTASDFGLRGCANALSRLF